MNADASVWWFGAIPLERMFSRRSQTSRVGVYPAELAGEVVGEPTLADVLAQLLA